MIYKITDEYYLYFGKSKKISYIKYNNKKDLFNVVNESELNVNHSIKFFDSNKLNEQLYKIYSFDSFEGNKIITFECNLQEKTITKEEYIIIYENDVKNFNFYNRVIALNEGKCLIGSLPIKLDVYLQNYENKKEYFQFKIIPTNSCISNLLTVNDDYFIASTENNIIFYDTKSLSQDKIIDGISCIHSKNSLAIINGYIIALCNQGIALVLISSKECVQYIANEKNNKYLTMCFYNNNIFILNETIQKEDNDDDEEDEDEGDYQGPENKVISVSEYKMNNEELIEIKKHFFFNKENIEKEVISDLNLLSINKNKILFIGKNLNEMRISWDKEFITHVRKSHITKSGKCVLKKKYNVN